MGLRGKGKHFEEFAGMVQSVLVEGRHPHLVILVCTLGVLQDSLLTLTSHTAAFTSNSFYHLQSARTLHSLVDDDLVSIHAFIIIHQDYSNELYLGMKFSAFRKL